MNGDATQPGEPSNWQFKPDGADPRSVQSPIAQSAQSAEATPLPADPTTEGAAPVQKAGVVPISEEHPEVSWTAAEFIAHEKSPLWYLGLVATTVMLALLVLFLSHDKVSAGLITVIGIIFGVIARRQPRELQYLLDGKGITVNRAFRPYSDFKSFAIIDEGEINGVIFMPLQRFTLPFSLYVSPDETDEVLTKLSDYLPNDQTHGHDAIDRFVQRIHF
jgi:hypothetical protein